MTNNTENNITSEIVSTIENQLQLAFEMQKLLQEAFAKYEVAANNADAFVSYPLNATSVSTEQTSTLGNQADTPE